MQVTKRTPDQIDVPSRDGFYVHGLTLEGARWDAAVGQLEESRPKELLCTMVGGAGVGFAAVLALQPWPFIGHHRDYLLSAPPDPAHPLQPVILVRAVPVDKAEARDTYACPVYRTARRFREEVFAAQLRTKQPSHKWTAAGVALFLGAQVLLVLSDVCQIPCRSRHRLVLLLPILIRSSIQSSPCCCRRIQLSRHWAATAEGIDVQWAGAVEVGGCGLVSQFDAAAAARRRG